MKRISILTHSFIDAYNRRFTKIFGGGLERYIYDLCQVVKELGYEPEVHQLSFFEPFHTIVEDIEVFGYPYEFDEISKAFEEMAGRAKGNLIYASCIWHPIRYREGSLGICHGINWDRHDLPQEAKADVAKCVQNALNSLSRIVSVDSHFLTFCRSVCYYTDPERVILLPNSVDTLQFKPSERVAASDPGVVHVLVPRRISYERGIIPMMLTADRLLSAYDNIQITFAGELVKDTAIGDTFSMWLQEHPKRDRIRLETYRFDQMAEAYQQADIVVIPTIFSEGTSYSCLEALGCGLAVVTSNVGGLNDLIINGFNGLSVTPTEEHLFHAISRLAEDRELRQTLGRHARETALAFDKTIWRERWRSILSAYLGVGRP